MNEPSPWTQDEILLKHKFTNAYRASDRVSQYLIRNVIYKGSQEPDELFFRIILFKTFNKIDTWELLVSALGEISYNNYSFTEYSKILTSEIDRGKAIYSGAYIMTSGKSAFGFAKKFKNHLKLIELMMGDKIYQKVQQCSSMAELFSLLKTYPTIGDFLAYQYCIDINYSNLVNFSEMDFVFPGPGAKDGIAKCFTSRGDYSEVDIIKYMADIQHQQFERLEIDFKDLWGRPLQLIDCQNLFCEVDKYARVAHPGVSGLSGRSRIKQLFTPNHKQIDYFYPPKWGINANSQQ